MIVFSIFLFLFSFQQKNAQKNIFLSYALGANAKCFDTHIYFAMFQLSTQRNLHHFFFLKKVGLSSYFLVFCEAKTVLKNEFTKHSEYRSFQIFYFLYFQNFKRKEVFIFFFFWWFLCTTDIYSEKHQRNKLNVQKNCFFQFLFFFLFDTKRPTKKLLSIRAALITAVLWTSLIELLRIVCLFFDLKKIMLPNKVSPMTCLFVKFFLLLLLVFFTCRFCAEVRKYCMVMKMSRRKRQVHCLLQRHIFMIIQCFLTFAQNRREDVKQQLLGL